MIKETIILLSLSVVFTCAAAQTCVKNCSMQIENCKNNCGKAETCKTYCGAQHEYCLLSACSQNLNQQGKLKHAIMKKSHLRFSPRKAVHDSCVFCPGYRKYEVEYREIRLPTYFLYVQPVNCDW